MMAKKKSDYLPHDKYLVLHDNERTLRPIVLRLPDPPDLRLIEGYGLPIEEQRFKRMEIPEGLLAVEKIAVQELNAAKGANNKKVVTQYKIQQRFWDIIYSDVKKYAEEINFIKRYWWHRVNGYWFFNRGKPTYISGWHFMYLHVWTMNTDDGTDRPEYRDRDRKEFLFKEYAYGCTETFAKGDEQGYAIANPDGSYDMIDTGNRVCYGIGQSKNRRSGNTNKGLLECGEVCMTKGARTDGMIIFAETGEKAESHFKTKMMPAFDGYPIWLKPLTTSGRDGNVITFSPQTNDYAAEGLWTKISYAESGSAKAVDGWKLASAMLDESAKVLLHDVTQRWRVVKHCLAQGNGKKIHGWSYHPSTVEDMGEGGAAYRILLNQSDFYCRDANGQTKSGLFRMFIKGDEGLDGFIDSYGYSVKGKILDYQAKEGFTQTSTEFLQEKRDALLRGGSIADLQAYRHEKKLFPLDFDDSWLGEAGDIGFPLEKIDKRIADKRANDTIEKGNLKWVNDAFGGDVYWERDDENGRFERSGIPPVMVSNQKMKVPMFSVFENKIVDMYAPRYAGYYVIGADPYRFKNIQQDRMARVASGNMSSSKLSKGGIAVLMCKTEQDAGDNMEQWYGYRFTMSYSYRSSQDDYDEDLLKAAIYNGAMVYPETNQGDVEAYFIRKGFGGYLIYDIDLRTGQKKSTAGVHNIDTTKQRLFSLTKEYLEYRCHVEEHVSYLEECKRIRSMEEMTSYDRFAAHGLALMGAQSLYPSRLADNGDSYDLEDVIETWNY